jgi:hypothetical protein
VILLRGLFYLISLSVLYSHVTALQEVPLNETCDTVRTVKYMSDVHRVMFGLKQADVSALFCIKYALTYATTEVQANQKVLTLNWTLQLLLLW